MNRQNEAKRARILEIEKSFTADSSKWERRGGDPPQTGDASASSAAFFVGPLASARRCDGNH